MVSTVQKNIVWLEGEHDIATIPHLANTLAGATSADDADLVVDLSRVTFISAATIGLLIAHRNALRWQSRTLTLRSPGRFARRVLELCGLTSLIESQAS